MFNEGGVEVLIGCLCVLIGCLGVLIGCLCVLICFLDVLIGCLAHHDGEQDPEFEATP